VYEPLKGPRHIRLMVVHQETPGGIDAPRVELITRSIDSLPPYTALSYTWGREPIVKRPIFCFDRRCFERHLDIPINLYDALRYCRRKDLVEYMWADAVCIDPENDDEKNNQIPLMGDIYWHSQKTRE